MLALNFNPFPNLSTERLLFRQLTFDDANEIFLLRSDARVNRFLTRNQCKTIEEAGAFINKINRGIGNNDAVYWAITLKNDKKLVGTICLWNLQPENYRAEIGYELHPDYWKKGIMSEAIHGIIEYGFEVLNLHSIEADVDPANAQSVALLEKNGFIKEGHFRESVYFGGRFSDTAIYCLLRST
jgi:ribosomal-protein-alanine N-acetyltransferase